MNEIEQIIDSYIQSFGNNSEKEIHQIYKGEYLKLFSLKNSDLEESVEFGGGEIVLFSILVFILETVGQSIVEDGYKITKDKILDYIKKDKTKITKKSSMQDVALTTETIEKLIDLLQDELTKRQDK